MDVETSGPTPVTSFMCSFGACVVGDTKKQFYTELRPINAGITKENLAVSSKGLKYLDGVRDQSKYNPKSDSFDPEAFLKLAHKKGTDPVKAMIEFRDWVHIISEKHKPVLVARPSAFDAMWIHSYFDLLRINNPFGFGGEDMNSFYRGRLGNLEANISDILSGELSHNALDDAITQAKAFESILSGLKRD